MSQIMRKESSVSATGGGHRHRSIDIGPVGGGPGTGTGSESSIMELHRNNPTGPPPRSAPPITGGGGVGGHGRLPIIEKPRTISDSESEINYDLFNTSVHSDSGSAIMNASQISNTSNDSTHIKSANLMRSQNGSGSCRFPKLEECAHFHYERVQLGNLSVQLEGDERSDSQLGLASSDLSTSQTNSLVVGPPGTTFGSKGASNVWFIIRVTAGRSDPFMIKRSYENMCFLDEMLHRCVYDRRVSELENLRDVAMLLSEGGGERVADEQQQLEKLVGAYLARLSMIASDAMTCGPVLTWLQVDNKGRRLPVADEQTMRCINTPAVGAAYGVRRYVAQACDEISIEVGDMISVIDMPSPAESIWWRGKKSHLQKNQYEVGFFPQSCVATIGDKVPRHMPFPAPLVGSLAVSPTKPVLRKHGKLIAFFRSFILSRPSRRRLKQSGIYKERVFSCDLGEHLLNSGQDIPMVLKCCAEFIEEYGIVDGIYRLSGITSNIQKLRRAFDEERIPDLTHPDIRQDIHAVSSLLKMYFRELPNPLCTYQLYDHFVEAIQTRPEAPTDLKLRLIRQTVQKLPPPHYRTLKYLATHLFKIARHSASTGMTERNIAIVWAPNLLRSPALESGGVAALRGVGVQAVVTEYLISNCEQIFDDSADDFGSHYVESQPNSLSDSNSVQNYSGNIGGGGGVGMGDQSDLSLSMERPKSLSVGGAKLLSLEEARIRRNCMDQSEKTIPINISNNPSTHIGSYIEVGGGPSSLPDKYHTVLPVPRSWNKRKSHSSWKSIFTRQPRQSNSNSDIKGGIASAADKTAPMAPPTLPSNGTCPVLTEAHGKDADDHRRSVSIKESSSGLLDKMAKSLLFSSGLDLFDGKNLAIENSCVRSNSVDSLRTAGHSRSVSHDSYFDLLQSPMRAGAANGTASGGGVVTCPSRELSELGLNFDREEPEMRIFSESESLVSSPKVAKESVRRTLRARPEDYVGSGNSVNPSPKKQPRLNIPSATKAEANGGKQWQNSSITAPSDALGQDDESLCKRYKLEDQLSDIQFIDCNTPEHTAGGGMNGGAGSGSTTSSTMVNTIFTSAQVHKPPHQDDSADEQEHDGEETATVELVGLRNSYPGPQYAGYGKGNDSSPIRETRFSYPGSGSAAKCKEKGPNAKVQSMNVDEQGQQSTSDAAMLKKNESSLYESFLLSSGQSKPPKYPGRYSYHQPVTTEGRNGGAGGGSSGGADGGGGSVGADPSSSSSAVPRSCSENVLRRTAPELFPNAHHHHHHHHNHQQQQPHQHQHHPHHHHHHHHQVAKQMTVSSASSTKLTAAGTPQSPSVPSPCYSLLIGSTSSDTTTNSNANTPVYDEMDIAGAIAEHMEKQQQQQQNAKDDPIPIEADSPVACLAPSKSKKAGHDLKAMKRELSLDLSGTSKLTGSTNFTSDNTTNTTNTSQSLTPSDFAYQNLNPDLSPNGGFGAGGATDAAPVEMATFGQKAKPGTPIKATINITYNVRSPVRKEQEGNLFRSTPTTPERKPDTPLDLIAEEEYQRERRSIYENVLVPEGPPQEQQPDEISPASKRLLETNFDETMVYEQVKFLKNVVSEVNHLVQSETTPTRGSDEETAASQRIVPDVGSPRKAAKEASTEEDGINNNHDRASCDQLLVAPEREEAPMAVRDGGCCGATEEESDDVPMSDVNEDSLEFDNTDLSLYENVELRKKPIYPVYENIEQKKQQRRRQRIAEDGETHSAPIIHTCGFGNNPTDTLKSTLTDDEFSSLCADRSDLDNEMEYRIEIPPKIELKASPQQPSAPQDIVVSVRQLATKFETSPVDVTPPFDFGANRAQNHHFRSSLNNGNYGNDRVTIRNKSANSSSGTPGSGRGGGKDDHRNAFASFTRSLDENAFVREFGSGRKLESGGVGGLGGVGGGFAVAGFNKSIQQIPEVEKNILNENNPNRRKSLELSSGAARPRSLNQPKKLPPLAGGAPVPTGAENVEINGSSNECGVDGGKATSDCCRPKATAPMAGGGGGAGHKPSGGPIGNVSPVAAAHMKLDLSMKIEDTKEARAYNVRITPTTENRISLVQYNYAEDGNPGVENMTTDRGASSPGDGDVSNTPVLIRALGRKSGDLGSDDDRNSISSIKMLGSCKLDRSRIEKIKEERRHQLSEKYRSESFKGERDYGGGNGGNGKLKSKSKSELREFKEGDLVADRAEKKYDSLRFRSKSRAELLSSDGPFTMEAAPTPGMLGSVSLTAVNNQQQGLRPAVATRTRRISDEKNQNDIPAVTTTNTTTTTTTSSSTPSAGGPISDASISQVCDNKFELKTRQKFDVKRSSMDYPAPQEGTGPQKDVSAPPRERHSFNNGGKSVIVTRSNSSSGGAQ
uniref:GTPase-activating protein CdGAPr n=1 Tax=Anopheles atroparvus TaxID=41427 RepID=A0AAG5DBE8_ANOAO